MHALYLGILSLFRSLKISGVGQVCVYDQKIYCIFMQNNKCLLAKELDCWVKKKFSGNLSYAYSIKMTVTYGINVKSSNWLLLKTRF